MKKIEIEINGDTFVATITHRQCVLVCYANGGESGVKLSSWTIPDEIPDGNLEGEFSAWAEYESMVEAMYKN